MWHVSTHTQVFSENIPFSTQALLILLMSTWFEGDHSGIITWLSCSKRNKNRPKLSYSAILHKKGMK